MQAREFVEEIKNKDYEMKLEKAKELRLRLQDISEQRQIAPITSDKFLETTELGPEIPLRLDIKRPSDKKTNKADEEKKPNEEPKV